MSNVPLTSPKYWSNSLVMVIIGTSDITKCFMKPSSSFQIASIKRIYAAQYKPSGRLYLIHSAIFQSWTVHRRESIVSDSPNTIHHWYILRDLLLNSRYIIHPHVKKVIPQKTLRMVPVVSLLSFPSLIIHGWQQCAIIQTISPLDSIGVINSSRKA